MNNLPSLRAWHETGEAIQVGSWNIFTKSVGSGPPILVLHGFPTASYDYVRLVPQLSGDFRLIFFDFLGYGFSDKPRGHSYSLFEQADITEAIAAHYGLSEVPILTHDMGNSVALEILRRDRIEVSRLIMLNGSVLLDHYQPLITQKLLLNTISGPIISKLRLIRRPVFARQFGKVFAEQPSSAEIDVFWELIRYNDGMANYHLLIRYLNERLIHQHTWLAALQNDQAPLTVIWGQRDPVAVPKIADAILERRPDAAYYPLQDAGHFPQWEVPDVVAKLVKQAFQ
jgi:pimeloyl-ACP methyl ester carboxylesterase